MVKRKKFVQKERREKRAKETKDAPLFKKPTKYKIGDTVKMTFLGVTHLVKIIDLQQRATWAAARWVFKCEDLYPDKFGKKWKYPFVGIGTSEEYCNIVVEKTK